MDNIKTVATFTTNNADLATFLLFEGIKLLEYRVADINKRIVEIRFLDEKRNCLDLERIYLNSDFKKFRDINKYILASIHKTLRGE